MTQPMPAQVPHDLVSFSNESKPQTVSGEWSIRIADQCMKQYPVLATDWGDEWGLVLYGLEQVWLDTKNRKYLEFIKQNLDAFITPEGSIHTYRPAEYRLDNLNPGRALFRVYQETGDEKYKQAIKLLRKQLRRQPRTSEGGFWYRKSCPFQTRLDGVYKVSPFYIEFAKTFGEPSIFDDVTHQILLIERHTRDPKTGLFYQAWDESRMQKWANPQTGCAPQFRSRAMGWYAMAIVDALDFLPASHQARDRIITILTRIIHALTLVQDPASGLWFRVLDEEGNVGNESDATSACMFVYAMLKAIRMGYLTADSMAVAQNGFAGIIRHLTGRDENESVALPFWGVGLQQDEIRDSSCEPPVHEATGMNDLTGIGALILASTEMERLSKPA